MRRNLICIGFLLLGAVPLLNSQETPRPQIDKITVLPSEPITPTGSCRSSTAGYLELKGKTKLSETEIGKFVDSSLRDGYVVTIYPATKRGIFVNMECISTLDAARVLAHP